MEGMEAEHTEPPRALEHGDIFFFYRPPAEHESAESTERPRHFHVVLKPEGEDVFRLITIQAKTPSATNTSGHERADRGVVTKVETTVRPILDELKGGRYHRRTGNQGPSPAMRPAGEGVYSILLHQGHTHLMYTLELPHDRDEAPLGPDLQGEASYILTVINPETSLPPRVGVPNEKKADYPEALQDVFANRRFAPADPPDLLNYPGTELFLIAASANVGEVLGVELDPDRETEETGDALKELQIRKALFPPLPLSDAAGRYQRSGAGH
jgi:hypothetical protein